MQESVESRANRPDGSRTAAGQFGRRVRPEPGATGPGGRQRSGSGVECRLPVGDALPVSFCRRLGAVVRNPPHRWLLWAPPTFKVSPSKGHRGVAIDCRRAPIRVAAGRDKVEDGHRRHDVEPKAGPQLVHTRTWCCFLSPALPGHSRPRYCKGFKDPRSCSLSGVVSCLFVLNLASFPLRVIAVQQTAPRLQVHSENVPRFAACSTALRGPDEVARHKHECASHKACRQSTLIVIGRFAIPVCGCCGRPTSGKGWEGKRFFVELGPGTPRNR
jgi:hypothetical protein